MGKIYLSTEDEAVLLNMLRLEIAGILKVIGPSGATPPMDSILRLKNIERKLEKDFWKVMNS